MDVVHADALVEQLKESKSSPSFSDSHLLTQLKLHIYRQLIQTLVQRSEFEEATKMLSLYMELFLPSIGTPSLFSANQKLSIMMTKSWLYQANGQLEQASQLYRAIAAVGRLPIILLHRGSNPTTMNFVLLPTCMWECLQCSEEMSKPFRKLFRPSKRMVFAPVP